MTRNHLFTANIFIWRLIKCSWMLLWDWDEFVCQHDLFQWMSKNYFNVKCWVPITLVSGWYSQRSWNQQNCFSGWSRVENLISYGFQKPFWCKNPFWCKYPFGAWRHIFTSSLPVSPWVHSLNTSLNSNEHGIGLEHCFVVSGSSTLNDLLCFWYAWVTLNQCWCTRWKN